MLVAQFAEALPGEGSSHLMAWWVVLRNLSCLTLAG